MGANRQSTTRYTASHARAAAWVLVATALFGWVVAGCDADSKKDIAACWDKCIALGAISGRATEGMFSAPRANECVCSFPMPFADAGTR